MRVTGWGAVRGSKSQLLRNLVDLKSTGPVSAFRRGFRLSQLSSSKKCEAWILEGSLTLAVNTVITSIEFRSKARDLGFEAKGSAEDDGLRLKAKAMPRGTQSGVSSYEVIDQRS
jgi:hypothetical protein